MLVYEITKRSQAFLNSYKNSFVYFRFKVLELHLLDSNNALKILNLHTTGRVFCFPKGCEDIFNFLLNLIAEFPFDFVIELLNNPKSLILLRIVTLTHYN